MNQKRSSLGIIFLTLFIDLVGFSIIFPLFPEMLDHYFKVEAEDSAFRRLHDLLEGFAGGEDAEARRRFTAVLFGGFLGSLYSTLQFLFAPVWGSLSDRIGRRPVLLYSIGGTVAAYLLWVFSGSFAVLIASRLLAGCMAGNISTASAAVADATSRENRAKGMGIIGAAFGLGFILGPAIGGLAYKAVGGRESVVDLLGRYPSLAGIGINPFSAPALAAFALASLNLLWVAGRFKETLSPEKCAEARSRPRPLHPLLLLGRIQIPGVNRANLAYFLFLVAFAGVEFTLTFFTYDAFGYRTMDMVKIFTFSGLIIALVQGGLVRRLAPRFGEKNVAVFGLSALVPGFFLVGFSPPSQVQLYAGLFCLALGSALTISCLSSLVSLYTPMDRQGMVLGVFRSLGALSRAVGPIIFCTLYWKYGRIWPYAIGGALVLVPIGLTLLLHQPEKQTPEGAASPQTPA
jgi:MFS family permease